MSSSDTSPFTETCGESGTVRIVPGWSFSRSTPGFAAASASVVSFSATFETLPLKMRGRSAAKFFSVPTTITAIGCLP